MKLSWRSESMNMDVMGHSSGTSVLMRETSPGRAFYASHVFVQLNWTLPLSKPLSEGV